MKVLLIDVGGTSAKLMASCDGETRTLKTGRKFAPGQLVKELPAMTRDWDYDVISLGFPGIVAAGSPAREPANLGPGWVGFDFSAEFEKPVRIVNDAALQAMGSYRGGRMLFLGFGTAVGCTLIADQVVVPLEIGSIRISANTRIIERLPKRCLLRYGHPIWQRSVEKTVLLLKEIFWPDEIVLGGGNAKRVEPLPAGCRRGENRDAFAGALRLWGIGPEVATQKQTTVHSQRRQSEDNPEL